MVLNCLLNRKPSPFIGYNYHKNISYVYNNNQENTHDVERKNSFLFLGFQYPFPDIQIQKNNCC